MRVIDPGSPLCGWDLLCDEVELGALPEGTVPMYDVLAARRIEVLVGDRPLQYSPPNGMGMTIDGDRVEPSPLGDGQIEIAVDSSGLYGEHLERMSFSTPQMNLELEIFESAVIAVFEREGLERPLTKSWFGPPDYGLLKRLEGLFDVEDYLGIEEVLGGDDGRAQA